MARGSQLTQLVIQLREEVSRSASLGVGASDLPELQQKLRRVQTTLYDEYDWPFLRQMFPVKQMQASEQFYDFPTGVNLERIEEVVVWYNGLPIPLTRGIGFSDYSAYNSNEGVTSQPAMKWDVRWTGTTEQMEIWPLPVDNSQTVQIRGIRKLRPLIADSDVADLDDTLIVLTVAAEMLLKQGNANAPLVKKAATDHLFTLRGNLKGASRTRRMGQGSEASDPRLPIVVRTPVR